MLSGFDGFCLVGSGEQCADGEGGELCPGPDRAEGVASSGPTSGSLQSEGANAMRGLSPVSKAIVARAQPKPVTSTASKGDGVSYLKTKLG